MRGNEPAGPVLVEEWWSRQDRLLLSSQPDAAPKGPWARASQPPGEVAAAVRIQAFFRGRLGRLRAQQWRQRVAQERLEEEHRRKTEERKRQAAGRCGALGRAGDVAGGWGGSRFKMLIRVHRTCLCVCVCVCLRFKATVDLKADDCDHVSGFGKNRVGT